MALFDRSFLAPAQLEFVVMGDTHHILDPGIYSAADDSMTPELARDWSARAGRALALAGELDPPFVLHLGDLTQEYPESRFFAEGREAARRQLEGSGLPLMLAPGNMDIGDKPDPTILAGWVEPGVLQQWESEFGKSFYSFDRAGCHFIVLNSQIMNGDLVEAGEQRQWLEADLEASAGRRVFLFLHMPPFLVDEDEPALGSYDVLGEPSRTWLLRLVREFGVEAIFSGHTHFRVFNRVGETRLWGAPSTTLTRPGFYEAFSVLPPDQGRSDVAKLGFFFVRVLDDRASVHLIRTGGETEARDPPEARRIVTCTPRDLRYSPLGVYLRHPLSHKSDGVVAYPNHTRHRIRDDYPLLACLELGLHHVRFPASDLDLPFQRERLLALRDEGVALTATALWPCNADLPPLPEADTFELQLVNRVEPDHGDIARIEGLRARSVSVSIAPVLMEDVGKVHRRPRVGFRSDELASCGTALDRGGGRVDRALCLLDPAVGSPWEGILAFAAVARGPIDALDFVLQLGEDEQGAAVQVAEALLAAATVPACRLYVDPLHDLDRTADIVRLGLLDRLSNPRAAFDVARTLNTLLFGGVDAPGSYAPLQPLGVTSDRREIRLFTGGCAPDEDLVVDLVDGRLSLVVRRRTNE
jgi:predicted phosphodiesterase